MKEVAVRSITKLVLSIQLLTISSCSDRTEPVTEQESQLFLLARDSRDKSIYTTVPRVTLMQDGDTLKSTVPEYSENYLWFGKFKKGNYTIAYKNIFDQEVKQKVFVTGAEVDTILLYLDYVDYSSESYQPIIDTLQEGDSFTIHFKSVGCEHHEEEQLVIEKRQGTIRASQGDKTTQLTNEQIESIRKFEVQSTLNPVDGGCTTTDYYTFSFKEVKREVTDGGCDWNGFWFLNKQLWRERL